MRSRVQDALDKVRPALKADGGDARIVACDEKTGTVSIQMLGACKGCPLSQLDFAYAIESLIRREVPEVREIVAVYLLAVSLQLSASACQSWRGCVEVVPRFPQSP